MVLLAKYPHAEHLTICVDHLRQVDPKLPLGDIVQDLCSTDPTQESCDTKIMQIVRLPRGNVSY